MLAFHPARKTGAVLASNLPSAVNVLTSGPGMRQLPA
jgi:hypothetical protein